MARDSSMKQLASSPESDTIQLPSPKVMNASPQMRLATKKNKLQFISPLSSELSSEKELGSDPPRDELNATSSKASIDRQQPSVEIHIKQSHSITAPGKSLCAMKCNRNSLNHISMLANQLPAIQYQVCHTLNTTLVNQWGMQLLYMKQAWNCNKMNFLTCESLQERPEVMVSLPVAGATESGGGIYPYSILTFSLGDQGHIQIYPGTSKAESTIPSSAASARLLAVKEGYVGVLPGERGMEQEPPAGESPGELYLGQPHLPLPHHQRDPQMNRDHWLWVNVGADGMYSRDDQFSYDGIPYHPSMNPRWYDPSHRGSEFILPPPYAAHRYPAHSYANDPTIHWPPGMKGFRHHTNVPPPFHGVHETEYANEPTKMLYWIQPTHQLAAILHLPEMCEKPKDSLGTGGYVRVIPARLTSVKSLGVTTGCNQKYPPGGSSQMVKKCPVQIGNLVGKTLREDIF
ncbi:hypothetical protein EDD17DRAFT_1509903 [Pisolithus thermaeus]|nr:hypothetical protein EDD17DRAFT_1509903 [Pisolithus thermaeus]